MLGKHLSTVPHCTDHLPQADGVEGWRTRNEGPGPEEIQGDCWDCDTGVFWSERGRRYDCRMRSGDMDVSSWTSPSPACCWPKAKELTRLDARAAWLKK